VTQASDDQGGAAVTLSAFGDDIVNNDCARHFIRVSCIGSPVGKTSI
jgi:hypothetical protein